MLISFFHKVVKVSKKVALAYLILFLLIVTTVLTVLLLPRGGTEQQPASEAIKKVVQPGKVIYPEQEQVLMWEVSKPNGGKVYLVGSIHVGRESMHSLNSLLTDAFDESDKLAVECDTIAIKNDDVAMLRLARYMVYTDGTTLKDHIPADLLKKVDERLATMSDMEGLTVEQMHTFDATVISDMIRLDMAAKVGYDTDLGIDEHFLQLAKDRGMPIIEIESAVFQAKLFKKFSDEIKEFELRSLLDMSLDDARRELNEMMEVWVSGDTKKFNDWQSEVNDRDLKKMTDREKELWHEYQTKILTDRNVGMADKIEELLNNKKTYFYVVGAAHYFDYSEGDGIISLLVQRGYTIKKY
ncbi:TraB/GumN family protein [Candidatus Saccharibacteria bacterium]|nr:TraB/GumN family protein [Candidatus Saccharibacteria bacterium]